MALASLAQLAELNLQALLDTVTTKNRGRREDLVEKANERLRAVFNESWGQSDLTVRLAIQDDVLEVLISIPGGGYNEIQERSDGLRSFVALRGFLAKKNLDIPPILLVDLFAEQRLAAKVIYSTHSAGCLPRDLGNGIRVVVPVPGSERSGVENSVWRGQSAGFTPLIYGMGATTFAFLPARFVVLGEGPSDAMLYPTLFREAVGLEHLSFQIAPGLANIAPEGMPSLRSEGGTVVFLTDGDKDGLRYRTALRDQGVPENRIFGLDEEFGETLHLEDLIDPELYVAAANNALKDFQQATAEIKSTNIPSANRLNTVAKWCKQRNLKAPDKIAVAQRLLDTRSDAARRGENVQLLSKSRAEGLAQLYTKISSVFKNSRA